MKRIEDLIKYMHVIMGAMILLVVILLGGPGTYEIAVMISGMETALFVSVMIIIGITALLMYIENKKFEEES